MSQSLNRTVKDLEKDKFVLDLNNKVAVRSVLTDGSEEGFLTKSNIEQEVVTNKLLEKIYKELKVMNYHLSIISDHEIEAKELK